MDIILGVLIVILLLCTMHLWIVPLLVGLIGVAMALIGLGLTKGDLYGLWLGPVFWAVFWLIHLHDKRKYNL